MTTFRALAACALALALWMPPVADAHVPGTSYTTPGHELALATAASLSSLVYFPAKMAMAAVGMLGGGLAGVLTGGDTRAAYAVWVPLVGGDYLVRPAHVDGVQPLEVFGTHYDDEPSPYREDGSMIYDALYNPGPVPDTDTEPEPGPDADEQ